MNYFLLRQKNLNANVPEGLSELMTDIAREVLRKQPEEEEMYQFIAEYLEALLKARNTINTSQNIVDELIEQTIELRNILQKNDIDFEKAVKSSKIIQASFRKYSTSNGKHFGKKLNETELLCDLVKKCNFTKQEIFNANNGQVKDIFKEFCEKYIYMSMKKEISEEKWTKIAGHLRDCVKIKSDPRDLNEAAIKIQAAFKGYIVRKEMNNLKIKVTKSQSTSPDSESMKTEVSSDSSVRLINKDIENAAIKIQAMYRGYRTRHNQKDLQKAALKIQSVYRGYKTRKKISDENKAAVLIQTLYRRYRERRMTISSQLTHKGSLKTLKDENKQGSGRKLSVRFEKKILT